MQKGIFDINFMKIVRINFETKKGCVIGIFNYF